MRKRTLKAFAGALVAAALVVAPLVTAGASAAGKDKEPAQLVGVVGERQPFTPETNQTSYWKKQFSDTIVECYSAEGNTSHGKITDGGKTVTLNPYQDSWPGDRWELLVVKGGAEEINVIKLPKAGVAYASLENNGGQQSNVSHWIVCKGKTPEVPQTPAPTQKIDCTSITVDYHRALRNGDHINFQVRAGEREYQVNLYVDRNIAGGWDTMGLRDSKGGTVPLTQAEVESGVITWKYSELLDDPAFTVTFVQTNETDTWPNLQCGTPEEEEPEPTIPDPKVERGEWTDGAWKCGDTTVTQTRNVVTTTYKLENGAVVPTVENTTETQTRPLTSAEIGEKCDLVPGDINAVCVGDVPYLGYELTLPAGYVVDSKTPVTITFLNPEGENYVVKNQPLDGELLWPGASATAPKMWPGWELVGGEYVKTDGNYDWTREGVTVRFEVNPSYFTEVEYPKASAECANPPIGGPDGSEEPTPGTVTPGDGTPAGTPGTPAGTPAASADASALAVTGGGLSPLVVAAGGAALAAGIIVLAIAAHRRRNVGAGTES
ncbi:hypothetical protein ACFFIR_03180 [Microbacterium arthrosphaerae]|uniref:hypothetical protein n=1 Tax=Microbacterium arthrosphaerae TaxID=792652 RepID=UPI0035EB7CFD